MPPGANCSPISKVITIVSGSTPPSDTSPPINQQNPRNPGSTLPGEGQSWLGLSSWTFAIPALFPADSALAEAARLLGAPARTVWDDHGWQKSCGLLRGERGSDSDSHRFVGNLHEWLRPSGIQRIPRPMVSRTRPRCGLLRGPEAKRSVHLE